MNENQNGFQSDDFSRQETPHCPRCGAPMENGAVFCGNCGLQLHKAQKPETDVLSVWDYILMMVIFSLPVVGLVLMIYWSFGAQTAVNRKNFARAYLIFYAVSLILSLLMVGAVGSLTAGIMESGAASLF